MRKVGYYCKTNKIMSNVVYMRKPRNRTIATIPVVRNAYGGTKIRIQIICSRVPILINFVNYYIMAVSFRF